MRRLALLAFLGVALLPSLASAQISVSVLGLRSATADEAIATRVTDALRQAAESATTGGYVHSGRENALAQMLIVFDCSDTTPDCMREIGTSLNSDRLIYGLIAPSSGRANANYTVTLHFYNVAQRRVERNIQEEIERGASGSALIDAVSRFYGALTGTVVRGELAIRANVAGAQVLINNRAVGRTSDEPLVLRDLEPGEITVAVRHDDYPTFERTVQVEAGQLQELNVTLSAESSGDPVEGDPVEGDPIEGDPVGGGPPPPPPPPEDRDLVWLGWTLFGLAAASFGGGLAMSLVVNSNQSELEPYQTEQSLFRASRTDGGETDICLRVQSDPQDLPTGVTGDEGAALRDACDVSAPQALQFVFYGISVAAVIPAIILLVREYGRRNAAQAARRFHLAPSVVPNGAALSAGFNF